MTITGLCRVGTVAALLVAPLAVAVLPASSAAVETGWTPVVLEDVAGWTGSWSITPWVAAAGEHASAVWWARSNEPNDVALLSARTSDDAGQTWNPTVRFVADENMAADLSVAVSQTATVVIAPLWAMCSPEQRCTDTVIARLADGKWTTRAVTWTPNNQGWGDGVLRYADGHFYFLAHALMDPVLLRSDDDGVTWQRLQPPRLTGSDHLYSDLAASGSELTITGIAGPDSVQAPEASVWAVTSHDAGAHFDAPVLVDGPGWTRQGDVHAARVGATLVLAWTAQTRDSHLVSVRYAHSTDGGATFKAPVQVPGTDRDWWSSILLTATSDDLQLLTGGLEGERWSRFVSSDGASWIRAPAPPLPYQPQTVAAAGNRLLVGAWSRSAQATVLHTQPAVPPQVPVVDAVSGEAEHLAGTPVVVYGRGPASSAIRIGARDANGTATFAVNTDTFGEWSFRRAFAYNTSLTAGNSYGTSPSATVRVHVKVTINTAEYRYTDSRGRCVVRMTGGVYPYVPGAPVYIREVPSTPVGSTTVTKSGMSGRYSAMFGLACGNTHALYPMVSGRSSDGRVYAGGTTGEVSYVTTSR